MPITPYLKGQAFDPEMVKAMGIAFERACGELKLVDRNDPITTLVAQTVIGLAQRGIKTSDQLTAAALEELNKAPPRPTMGKTA
jgi:hypothetical protein